MGFINYVRAKVNGVEEKYKVEQSIKIEKTTGEEKVAAKVQNKNCPSSQINWGDM